MPCGSQTARLTCEVEHLLGAVGIYVPGGTAVLPSSALMLSVPAGIAGCKTIVLATPPRPDGSITPEVLWCAKRAGVTHILKAGGAQAVAAMAWGTETCPKVIDLQPLEGLSSSCIALHLHTSIASDRILKQLCVKTWRLL